VLEQSEQWLKRKCYQPHGTYLRPFAPNPAWKNASVFIVGLNPSTPFREEFESYEQYWDSLTRYPEHYYSAYYHRYQCREEQKSRTAKTISSLIELLKPLNVLVTNVYAYPTPNPKLIPKDIRQEEVEKRILVRLITICKPKVLLFHGREARTFADKYFKVKLDPYVEPSKQSTHVYIPNTNSSAWLFAYHHFIGRVEKHAVMSERLKQLANQIQTTVIKKSC
jgi:hypothetical protein